MEMSWIFPISDGPTNDIKTQFFGENNLFNLLAERKRIPLHYTSFPPKLLIRHKSLKDEISKRHQLTSTKILKVGTKRQSKIWNRIVQKTQVFSVEYFCCLRQFYQKYHYVLDQSTSLYSQFRIFESCKKLKQHKKLYYLQKIHKENRKKIKKSYNFKCCIVDSPNLLLYTMECILLPEWEHEVNPPFFIWFYKLLNFVTPKFIQVFRFIINLFKILLLLPPCQVFSVYICWKNVLELLVIRISTVPKNFMQISFTPKSLFYGFGIFWRTVRVYLKIPIKKLSFL